VKKGPARIRLSLSRPFTYAEKEYIRDMGRQSHIRLSRNGKLYVSSEITDSRDLYFQTRLWLEDTFVNIFPTAVRTFRELVK
jgi:hypothetical protein